MTATIQVTNSFNKAIRKTPHLKNPFEKALIKVLSNPRHYLTQKIKVNTKNDTPIFSTSIPSIGQGDAWKVLFANQNGLLLPFAIATHSNYEKIIQRVNKGELTPWQEKTVSMKLNTIKEFGETTPENALAVRSLS